MEAEFRAALLREGVDNQGRELLAWVSWLLPRRPLSSEMSRVGAAGRVKGADLWHLACALYFSPEPEKIAFLTLDERQLKVASALGFQVDA